MSLAYMAHINNQEITGDLLNNAMDSDIEMNLKPDNLVELGKNMIDDINQSHQFIENIMHSSHIPSAVEVRQIQDKVEEFNIDTQEAGKTVSIIIKDLDTLTRIQ